jgi:hypothetical protein
MARQMRNKSDGSVVTVHAHVITKNWWEYYILDNKRYEDVRLALVMGPEMEIGDFSVNEIRPYIVTQTSDLDDVMSAPGWEWVR